MPRSKTPATAALAATDEPATIVLRQFRQVFNAVRTHFQQVEKVAGIGGTQVWALSVVRERPGIGVSALAQAMSIHQSTASNLVRTLIERELVAAAKGGLDRRAVQLTVLPAGARLLDAVPGPFAGVLPDALGALPPRTLQRMQSDLARLIEQLGADEQGASVPLAEM